MTIKQIFYAVFSGLLFLLLIFSCSARQELTLDLSGEGTGQLELQLHPVLTAYLTDLSMVMSDDGDFDEVPIFDEIGIWNGFARNPSIELVSVEIPEREELLLEWSFSDLNEPFEAYPGTERPILAFSRAGELRIFDFYLAPENFYQVAEYFPLIDEDLLAYFGPNPDDPVPEDIYTEDLEFALEDYLEDQSIEEILDNSILSFKVKADGKILSVEGGVAVEGGAVFETPLIKFLTLNEPVSYRLVYTEE